MDKIKQVFSSSSKHGDETGESRAATSTGAHSSEQEHPIYDQMTGHGTSSTAQPTAAGTTSAGQTGISSGLGKSDNLHQSDRPTTLSAAHGNDGMSQASIKSGVIGFGNGQQGHAALPSNNQAESNLQRNQIVGGGDLATEATQGTSAHSGVPSQTTPHSGLDTRDQTGTAATALPSSASKTANTQAPFDQTLRQESYTADTDRSFPLAGGVAPKHASDAPSSTIHQETTAPLSSTHQQATTAPLASSHHGATAAPLTSTARDTTTDPSTSTHHPITGERELGTTEKSAGVHDGHGREGLAAAAGAAAVAAPLAYSQQKSVHDQGLETRQATHGDQPAVAPVSSTAGNTTSSNTQGAHPEALAAARAAAVKSGNQEAAGTAGGYGLTRPSGHRTDSRPHVPGEFPSPTPDESKTFLYYRSDLVPEPGAEAKLTPGHHGMHDQTLAPVSGTSAGTSSTAGPHTSNTLNKADPRVDSDRDGSTTLGSTTGTSAPHELRHTGTLDEPRPKSSDHEDHTGRNAALAGGLAGAAGLGYVASQKHDSSHVGSDTASPYSSTALDPRVTGHSSKLDEQRFDPQVKSTEPATHHALQTSNPAGITAAGTSTTGPSTGTASTAVGPSTPSATRSAGLPEGASSTTATGPVHKSSILNKLDPRVKEGGTKTVHAGEANTIPADKEAKEHHYGRDAALVGGGAAAGAGGHHALKHDNTPGSTSTTGTPRDSNNLGSTTAPLSSSTANTTATPLSSSTAHTSGASAPLSATTASTTAPLSSSTANTGGASAPLSSTTANTSAPLSSSTPSAGTADNKDADHHYGRDAALVGGGVATAAGIHHAAQRNDTGPTASTIPSQTGPIASTVPSQTGTTNSAPLASSNTPAAHTTAPLSSTTTPNQAGATDSQHHYGRDAALVGGGAATAAGVRHQLQRNDTPGTGTTVLPQDYMHPGTAPVSSSAAPVSSTAAPSHSAAPVASTTAPSSTTAAPVTSSHTRDSPTASASKHVPSYTGPLTTSGEPFYGAAGAPAPVADKKSLEKDHHGRDATLVGGAAAGAGGLAYASHHDKKAETGPASSTIGPHSSNVANVLDPRVQPDPSKQSHHQAGSTAQDPASRTIGPHDSNVANVLDPRVQPDPSKQTAANPATDARADKDHHYGRDAAIAGGAGAAGYGAYEAAKSYGDHRSTQPAAAMAEQRYDPTSTGAHAPNPVPTSGHYDYNNPATSRNVNEPAVGHHDSTSDHTSRNAGLGAAAVGGGALAGATYAGSKHGETHQAPSSSTQPLVGTTEPATSSYPQKAHGAAPAAPGTTLGATHGRYDSTQVPEDDHTKRNAALAGAGGVAAAGGAYAYSQQHDAEKERERLAKDEQERLKKEQHAHDKEQKKFDKEHAKEEKQAHKEEKEQHKHDKIVAAQVKEEKKHQKEEEKEAARLEKDRQKEAERLEKETEKDEKKKHGILGFLHRDKSKKEKRGSNDSSPRNSGDIRRSTDNPRHSKEYAAGGAALGAGTAAAAYEHDNHPDSPRWKGKNLLHKDPPEGHPARDALGNKDDIELTGGKREHMGVDGPIGRPDAISGYNETRAGVYGAQPLSEVAENKKVIEPHTGLPMNVGRYGDGAGGTDGSANIHGHHQHAGAGAGAGQATGSNLEEIKKNDTIY